MCLRVLEIRRIQDLVHRAGRGIWGIRVCSRFRSFAGLVDEEVLWALWIFVHTHIPQKVSFESTGALVEVEMLVRLLTNHNVWLIQFLAHVGVENRYDSSKRDDRAQFI